MVLLVAAGVGIALANMINKFAPLVLLSGSEYLSVFSKPQLDALSFGFLRLHSNGAILATAFWGLWLFPFGLLIFKSRCIPRVLGLLVLVAGVAYVATSLTSMVVPQHQRMVSKLMMPFYFCEVPIIFWLLIRGAVPSERNVEYPEGS